MYRNDEEADIIEIQNWSRNKKFLPSDLSKPFIHTFLLGCEGDKAKAKIVLENYFYARQSIPEMFCKRDPLLKENIQSWKASCFVPLKGKLNGCRVFLGTILNSEIYDYTTHMKQLFMCFDLLLKNNEWGNGDRVLVISYDKMKYENLQSYTIYITRKSAECQRDKFLPGKLRFVHNVHIPPFMKKVHEKFKPVLSEDDERLVIFHKNLKSLHNSVNPEILPLEFGGGAGPLKMIVGKGEVNRNDKWCEILRRHRDFFVEEEEKRMRETRIRVNML